MASRTDQTDPFFVALWARRPDLDLVLLPPERPPTGGVVTFTLIGRGER